MPDSHLFEYFVLISAWNWWHCYCWLMILIVCRYMACMNCLLTFRQEVPRKPGQWQSRFARSWRRDEKSLIEPSISWVLMKRVARPPPPSLMIDCMLNMFRMQPSATHFARSMVCLPVCMLKPREMPFGKRENSCGFKKPCVRWGPHWCHLTNKIERSVCGSDLPLRQSTIITCSWLYADTWPVWTVYLRDATKYASFLIHLSALDLTQRNYGWLYVSRMIEVFNRPVWCTDMQDWHECTW